jgi:hypothetical protein
MALIFERFNKVGGSFAPIVSIRRQGAFGFSNGALQRYGLNTGEWFCVLLYDKTANVVGIMPTQSKDEPDALKLVIRKVTAKEDEETQSGSISAKAFFNYYQIPMEPTRSFKSSWNEENKCILIDLNAPLRNRNDKDNQTTQPDETPT